MKTRPRLAQVLWLVVAAAMLLSANLFQRPLSEQSEQLGLVAPGNVVAKNNPELTLLNWMPGGLRAPLVTYWWITSQNLHQAGRHSDALQRAEWICALQPRFASVWDFQAWNMAWNISVMTHTPPERWKWVYNGVTLLRDKGIPANPRSMKLYQSLSWIYYFKIGGDTDEMNVSYKQRWAGIMQRVLGAPPAGDTAEVIAAFKEVADPSLLDKAQAPNPDKPIQARQLEALLLADEKAAALAKELAALEIGIDRSLLEAFNAWSNEYSVAVARMLPPRPKTDAEKSLAAIINDPARKPALHKLLAFVRAQTLYNEFKLDPQYMLGLMTKYKAPLDWRSAEAHGLYWAMYGIDTCRALGRNDIDALTANRVVLYSLNEMTTFGRLSVVENPYNAAYPSITRSADLRFIRPCHEQSIEFANAARVARDEKFDENVFRDGHRNYIILAIQMLYPAGKVKQAQELFDFLKHDYHMAGPEYEKDLQDFVWDTINKDGSPIPKLAMSQITSSLQMAFLMLAAGDRDSMTQYRDSIGYAMKVYKIYQAKAVNRNKFQPFEYIAANVLAPLLIEPRDQGYFDLYPMTARSQLYMALRSEMPKLLPMIYDSVTQPLEIQCKINGMDFKKAFPPPDGMDEYREKMQRERSETVGQ